MAEAAEVGEGLADTASVRSRPCREAGKTSIRTRKLAIIHPAPRTDKIDDTRMATLWTYMTKGSVGAARAARGAMSTPNMVGPAGIRKGTLIDRDLARQWRPGYSRRFVHGGADSGGRDQGMLIRSKEERANTMKHEENETKDAPISMKSQYGARL